MMHDVELLAEYAGNKTESAFTALVERNVPLVFSSALRQLGGNRALAEDVAQMVFANLARRAVYTFYFWVCGGQLPSRSSPRPWFLVVSDTFTRRLLPQMRPDC